MRKRVILINIYNYTIRWKGVKLDLKISISDRRIFLTDLLKASLLIFFSFYYFLPEYKMSIPFYMALLLAIATLCLDGKKIILNIPLG